MEQGGASRYWCHMCLQTVNPITGIEALKCPICESGFVEEETETTPPNPNPNPNVDVGGSGSESDRALSLWAPILLGMMANPIRHQPRLEADEDDADHEQMESLMRRRRRNSAAILQLLHGLRAGLLMESANPETSDENRDRDGQRVILINPFNQTIIVQGQNDRGPVGSLGDYFLGPGLDMLIQHLTENDPDRHGTPPAKKEAIEALNTLKVVDDSMQLQCCICLDDCAVGDEVKEMPCKHKFHGACIVPWLELHSSCPVCRYQLPGDESSSSSPTNTQAPPGNGRRGSLPLLWPFSSLFSSPNSQPSLALPSGSFTDAPSAASRADEN